MASGVPFGMVTPREAIEEVIRAERRKPGQGFYVKRLEQIRSHLAKCRLPRCPVSLLDLPMRAHEFDAVVAEAWSVVKDRDELKEMIKDMAAQGRA